MMVAARAACSTALPKLVPKRKIRISPVAACATKLKEAAMPLDKRYLQYDPGFVQLFGAMRASLSVLLLLMVGHSLHAISKATLLTTALCTIFSLVNLYQPNRPEKLKSMLAAQGLLSLSCLFGLYVILPHYFKELLFLIAVFLSYALTHQGPRWRFHPTIAAVLMLISTYLSASTIANDPPWLCMSFMLFAVVVNLCVQFLMLPDRHLHGIRHSLSNLLSCWCESVSTLDKWGCVRSSDHQNSHQHLNRLIMFRQRLALPKTLTALLDPMIAMCISTTDGLKLLGAHQLEQHEIDQLQQAFAQLHGTFKGDGNSKPIAIPPGDASDYPLTILLLHMQNSINTIRAHGWRVI